MAHAIREWHPRDSPDGAATGLAVWLQQIPTFPGWLDTQHHEREFLVSLHPCHRRRFCLEEQELAGDICPTLHVPNGLDLLPVGMSDLGGVLGSA